MLSSDEEDRIVREITENTENETPSLSPSFSSERFMFNDAPDEEKTVDCIDDASHLFAEFKKKPPTLEEALRSMEYGDERSNELSYEFLERADEKLKEFEAPGLTPEDVAAIFCYTYECDKEEGIESPFIKLNNSLSIDRSNASLKKTRRFMFLLLQSLRKLPRYTPANGRLYGWMDFHVKTEMDPNFPKRLPYAAGNEKTWWSFTSTTTSLELVQLFFGKRKGTLSTVSGEAWGYDISMFSDLPEDKEILLEPERKLKIMSVAREGDVIAVNAEMMKTPLVLEDLIKVKAVKFKERISRRKETPYNLRVENITETTVELSWSEPKGVNEDKILSYQVFVKEIGGGNIFNRMGEEVFMTRWKETKLTARNLRLGGEYEFRARCKFRDGWGKWSDKLVARTKVAFTWREWPSNSADEKRYSVDKEDPRIVTNTSYWRCTIPNATTLLPNREVAWSIKILESRDNDGDDIYIGVAPADIDPINDNCMGKTCGWYLNCYDFTLCSGAPQNYRREKYGPRKKDGEYVHTEGIVGVVMDTTNGELSFVLDGVNLGAAFKGIPLDNPLVPCVILGHKYDSIELIIQKQD